MAYDFQTALTNLKSGDRVKRTSWTTAPNFIVIFDPMSGSPAMGEIIMQDITGQPISEWNPQNIDLCTDDWETFI